MQESFTRYLDRYGDRMHSAPLLFKIARNALLDDAGAENLTVKRQSRGRLEAVAATRVRRGDELWISPGDLVPVDGVLLRKETEVSLDWITGESDPVALAPGDIAPAAAMGMMIFYSAASVRVLHYLLSRFLEHKTQAWRR